VGLDAVRASLRALGGDVTVQSAPGRGTRFELRVPVSLTVAPLLFVKVAEETLCLSAVHVSRALKVEASQLKEVAGRAVLEVDDQPMPFASLGSLLGLSPSAAARGRLVLVVRSQGATAALAVDRVLEERVQAILPLKGCSRASPTSRAPRRWRMGGWPWCCPPPTSLPVPGGWPARARPRPARPTAAPPPAAASSWWTTPPSPGSSSPRCWRPSGTTSSWPRMAWRPWRSGRPSRAELVVSDLEMPGWTAWS
jgi:hypothetical protein